VAGSPGLRSALSVLAFRVLGERIFDRVRARSVARWIKGGREREDELDLLGDLVAPGDTVVDAGANFGLYSFHLSQLVGEQGQVVAFEAIPETCLALRRVLRHLDASSRVEVIELALGESPGWGEFALPRRRGGGVDRGRAWLLPRARASSSVDRVNVRMTRLDDAIDADAEVTFIKVDTEGADLFVLRGAQAILGRSAPSLVLEVAPDALARHGLTGEDLDRFLGAQGYETYIYDGSDRRLTAARAAHVDGNLVAIHPRRRGRAVRFLG